MIMQGLRELFAGEATIVALLSRSLPKFPGVYIGKAPQKAPLPYLLLTRMDQADNESLEGTGGSGWLYMAEVDVDAKAATYDKAETLARAVNTFFRNYAGAAGDVTVEAVVKQGTQDGYEDLGDGTDEGRHIVTLDYQVQYRS